MNSACCQRARRQNIFHQLFPTIFSFLLFPRYAKPYCTYCTLVLHSPSLGQCQGRKAIFFCLSDVPLLSPFFCSCVPSHGQQYNHHFGCNVFVLPSQTKKKVIGGREEGDTLAEGGQKCCIPLLYPLQRVQQRPFLLCPAGKGTVVAPRLIN